MHHDVRVLALAYFTNTLTRTHMHRYPADALAFCVNEGFFKARGDVKCAEEDSDTLKIHRSVIMIADGLSGQGPTEFNQALTGHPMTKLGMVLITDESDQTRCTACGVLRRQRRVW